MTTKVISTHSLITSRLPAMFIQQLPSRGTVEIGLHAAVLQQLAQRFFFQLLAHLLVATQYDHQI
tara:strand:+ start:484 stop:678 length:195 start_codon:yes stop_codon:yes gene_type:complete